MRKQLCFILLFILVWNMAFSQISSANDGTIVPAGQLEIGDYFTLGKYKEKPIVWRYVADDEKGRLIVSDKILCLKVFGADTFWRNSYIRKWLNSPANEGEEVYDVSEDFIWSIEGGTDIDEKGFLHDSNFSQTEKSVMKIVTQWTMLPKDQVELSTNGNTKAYSGLKYYDGRGQGSPIIRDYYDFSEFPDIYAGAAHEVSDKIFLLDEMQLYHMWQNFGEVKAICAEGCKIDISGSDYSGKFKDYYLRSASKGAEYSEVSIATEIDTYESIRPYYTEGIRPAFYLNEENAVILSGNGTVEDPYVMGGKAENENSSGITVFCNGSEISFDQYPFLESDRVMVPMRMIFEALGADVQWNEEEQSVTATCGADTVKMQIGSREIWKNDTLIQTDVAPRLVGDRTFVPLRVISESLGASVEWIEEEQKVVITK